jgi:hypothetical protein
VVAALPPAVPELLRALRPAWWVLRAVLAAVLVLGAIRGPPGVARCPVTGRPRVGPAVAPSLAHTERG